MTTLTVKLWTAAQANPALAALLIGNSFTGTTAPFNGVFRWYDTQRRQNTPDPCVVVQQIIPVPYQSLDARNALSRYRTQFTIWEGQVRDVNAVLLNAVLSFLDSFTANGGGRPIVINSGADGFYAQTDPGKYIRTVEAYIFNNDTT